MTGFKSKRQMAQAKVNEDDDTQVYADTLTVVYQRGFADGKKAARPEQQAEQCIGKDPRCPCQDGDACHYKDCVGTKALPVAQPEQEPVAKLFGTLPVFDTPPAAQRPWVGLEAEDLAQIESDEFWQVGNHMAIAMAVEAKLKERNT